MKPKSYHEEAQTLIRILGREDLIAYYLSRLQAGKRLATRPVIITSYAQLNPVESLPLLKEVVVDSEEVIETRVAAVKAVGMLIERRMLPQADEVTRFLAAILDSSEISLRSTAAIALARLEERSFLPKLRQLYEGGRLEVLAAEAVRNLAVRFDKNFLVPPTALFLGRGKELQDISTRLQRDHLVLITGLAGMGKTALAAEFSRRSRYEFKIWISLASATNIQDVVRSLWTQIALTFNTQLFLRESTDISDSDGALAAGALADSISTLVGFKNLLIAIDNIQNVPKGGEFTAFCYALLKASPTISVILIGNPQHGSIDISPSYVVTLGELKRKDSIKVLEALAPSASPKLIEAAAALGQGHPLSLRLMAESISSSNSVPSEKHLYNRLAAAIEEALKGLTSIELATLELFAHIGSAVNLDDPMTRSLFEDQVVGFSSKITDELIQAGLIYSTQESLAIHWPLRARFQETVDERTRLRINRRLAKYFLDRGDPHRAVIHHERVDPIAALDLLLTNLRQLVNQGRIQWACTMLERLIRDNRASGRDQTIFWRSLAAIGDLKYVTGTLVETINYYELAFKATEEVFRHSYRSSIANKIGKAYLALGDRQCALDMHKISDTYAQEDLQPDILNRNLTDLARVHAFAGSFKLALDICTKAVQSAQATSDTATLGYCTANLANIVSLQSPAEALELFREALDLTTDLDDLRLMADILTDYGGATVDLKEAKSDSIEILNNALSIARTIHDKGVQSRAMLHLGRVLAKKGREQQSITHFEHALRLAKYRGDRRLEGVILWNKSVSLDELGRRGDALASAKTALNLLEELGDPISAKVRETLRRLRR